MCLSLSRSSACCAAVPRDVYVFKFLIEIAYMPGHRITIIGVVYQEMLYFIKALFFFQICYAVSCMDVLKLLPYIPLLVRS